MSKHASASLAVLDLVMASPSQPAARRSPRRPCLLSARSDGQPLLRPDQKGKLKCDYVFYRYITALLAPRTDPCSVTQPMPLVV